MVDTEPRKRDPLLERYPELAAFERTAVRLHPRRGWPTAEDSSVGGPMVWPVGEARPVCGDEHDLVSGGPDLDMVPVLQLHRRDLPSSALLPPGWMFPGGSDLLQVLWCPYPHMDTYAPRARLFWRERARLGRVELIDPPPPASPEDDDEVKEFEHIPRRCVLHPELVREYPPISIDDPEESDFAETLLGILPPELELACARWTVPDRPWDDGNERDHTEQDYTEHCTVPGWRLGGWVPTSASGPGLPSTTRAAPRPSCCWRPPPKDIQGPWLPAGEPGFRWEDPDDGWAATARPAYGAHATARCTCSGVRPTRTTPFSPTPSSPPGPGRPRSHLRLPRGALMLHLAPVVSGAGNTAAHRREAPHAGATERAPGPKRCASALPRAAAAVSTWSPIKKSSSSPLAITTDRSHRCCRVWFGDLTANSRTARRSGPGCSSVRLLRGGESVVRPDLLWLRPRSVTASEVVTGPRWTISYEAVVAHRPARL